MADSPTRFSARRSEVEEVVNDPGQLSAAEGRAERWEQIFFLGPLMGADAACEPRDGLLDGLVVATGELVPCVGHGFPQPLLFLEQPGLQRRSAPTAALEQLDDLQGSSEVSLLQNTKLSEDLGGRAVRAAAAQVGHV